MNAAISPPAAPAFSNMAAAAILVPKPAERPEVAALIPAALDALRARGLNTVEKRDVSRHVTKRLAHYGEDCSYLRPIGTSPSHAEMEVRRKAHNDGVWADSAALDQTARECNLTPERAAKLRVVVARDLPRWIRYREAVEIIADHESNHEEPPKSPITDAIREEEKRRFEDLSDELSYAMTGEQVALVESLTGRGYSSRDLWAFARLDGYRNSVLALPLKAPYVRMAFDKLVERCRTQRELRLLIAAYGLEARSERVEWAGQKTTRVSVAGLCEITAT